MAFPQDYHLNDSLCNPQDKWVIHQWSTMGHPLTHRCNLCHRPKWVRNPDQVEPRKSEIYLPNVRS